MGDQFYDEGKFFASNVHVILGRLDRVIRNKKKLKHTFICKNIVFLQTQIFYVGHVSEKEIKG